MSDHILAVIRVAEVRHHGTGGTRLLTGVRGGLVKVHVHTQRFIEAATEQGIRESSNGFLGLCGFLLCRRENRREQLWTVVLVQFDDPAEGGESPQNTARRIGISAECRVSSVDDWKEGGETN